MIVLQPPDLQWNAERSLVIVISCYPKLFSHVVLRGKVVQVLLLEMKSCGGDIHAGPNAPLPSPTLQYESQKKEILV